MSWGQNRYLDEDRQKKIFTAMEIERDKDRDRERQLRGMKNVIGNILGTLQMLNMDIVSDLFV